MNSNNNDWVLLMAGYTEEMLALLSANVGFDSRIPVSNRFVFEDYTVNELMSIADKFCNDNNYFLTSDARLALKNRILSDYKRETAHSVMAVMYAIFLQMRYFRLWLYD